MDADAIAFDRLVSAHKRDVRLLAYHLTGSLHEADDVLQEVLLRAWRSLSTLSSAAAARAWLRRIATNLVIDRGRAARRRPELVGLPWDPSGDLPPPTSEWVEPFPDSGLPVDAEQRVASRQALELGFVGLLQGLPVRQRAVWVLRELLDVSAAETAEALGLTEDAVTSALARARSTLAARPNTTPVGTAEEHVLAARYAEAFAASDLNAIVALLHDEVVVTMPPFEAWLSGAAAVQTFAVRHLGLTTGTWKVVPVSANGGRPALALYRPTPTGDVPFGLKFLTVSEGLITRLDVFVMPDLFAAFGLSSD